MSRENMHFLHATAVEMAGRGLLITGRSGAGKSGLALRLVCLGATLVSDDRVRLERAGEAVLASPPQSLAGLIEARGLGVLRAPYAPQTELKLVVDLDAHDAARLPQARTIALLGVELELIYGRDVPNLDQALTILMQNGRLDVP